VYGQESDSALARIEHLVTAGDRAGARAVAESLLAIVPSRSPQYPDVLYWRAFTAANAAEAERDYLRLSIEYPLSRHAADALLNLALLEYARGDRRAAQRHFERLLLEHPTGPLVAKATYWSGRLSLEGGESGRGCSLLSSARRAVSRDDIELLNQIDYYESRCAAATDSATPAGGDTSTRATRGDSAVAAGGNSSRAFSIQVGAFTTKSEATRIASRMKQRGFSARVAGDRAPYRVRIGRFATRQEAAAELARVRRTSPKAIVVEAEPQ
jgi:tetratricopeptide (TPR) repeat protein